MLCLQKINILRALQSCLCPMIDDNADDWIICWLYTDICSVWIICRISLYLRSSGWCMLPTWGGLRGNLLITCWGRSHVGNEYWTIVYPPYSIIHWPQILSIVTCLWFIIWRVYSLRRLIGKYNWMFQGICPWLMVMQFSPVQCRDRSVLGRGQWETMIH